MTTEEKRKYPRLNLNIEDGYFGNFQLPTDESIVAPIVNLSAGGLNMAAADGDSEKIKAGDKVLLNHIAGGTNLSFLNQIKAEVRWVKKLNRPGYYSVGCRFEGLSAEARQQIFDFVASERMSRGQYD